jgi:hypothetical protein
MHPSGMQGAERGIGTSSASGGVTTGDPNQFTRGSSVSGSSSTSGLGSSGNVDVKVDTDSQGSAQDLQNATTDAQYKASEGSVSGRLDQQMGAGGRAVISGDTQEGRVMQGAGNADVVGTAQGELDVGEAAHDKARNAARNEVQEQVGLTDPTSKASRAQSAGYEASAKLDHGKATYSQGQAVAADPTGSAKHEAMDRGMREVNERAPVNPSDVEAKVNTGAQVVRDPAAAGEAHVEVEVDAKVRGVDPTKK